MKLKCPVCKKPFSNSQIFNSSLYKKFICEHCESELTFTLFRALCIWIGGLFTSYLTILFLIDNLNPVYPLISLLIYFISIFVDFPRQVRIYTVHKK
ncbi:MAG: hypothetical protein JEY94_14185 [Melioribacteraceae bacterium]|nr:hypothetical protein [Melioribacteraceae bacterium]